MSGSIGLGVPVPKMLPITGTWTLPFAAYLAFLSNRVVYRRLKNEKYIGNSLESDPKLELENRAHGNFVENVPLALVLSGIAELNGADRKVLNYVLATLFALRILHAEVGIRGEGGLGWGRPVGYYGTQTIIAGVAAWSSWLVKGYWGF